MLSFVLSLVPQGAVRAATVSAAANAAVFAPKKLLKEPKSSKARKLYKSAVEAYRAGEFEKAATDAKEGLLIEENEGLLFILGEAQRLQDDCVSAVENFTRFIEIAENDQMRENAETAKAFCAEKLAEEAREAKAQREAEEAAAAAAAAAEAAAQPEPEPEPVRPWYRDPLGAVLVGVGGAAVLGGGATLLAAAVLDPSRAPDYGTFDRRRRLRPQLVWGGAITAGVGALIAAGGGLRWGLLARQQQQAKSDTARVRMSPWLDRTQAGLTISGRF